MAGKGRRENSKENEHFIYRPPRPYPERFATMFFLWGNCMDSQDVFNAGAGPEASAVPAKPESHMAGSHWGRNGTRRMPE